jgi:hypothetical protein
MYLALSLVHPYALWSEPAAILWLYQVAVITGFLGREVCRFGQKHTSEHHNSAAHFML